MQSKIINKEIKYLDIPKQDISNWINGEFVLIDAPTGKGKSYFVKNTLYDYAKENNKKILFFTNRNILRNQFHKELSDKGKTDIITIINYQKLESVMLYEKITTEGYDYIVLDECHYFFSDAQFNNRTDLMLDWLDEVSDSVVVLMSGTVDLVKRVFKDYIKHTYEIEQDYSYIENIYFYKDNEVIERLLVELPIGEKAIYFTGAKQAYDVSKRLKDGSFICSEYNKVHSKSSNKVERQNIEDNNKFECKVLCCTTALDNGINIVDDDVKHVIIDVFDIDTLQQCLGRKRITSTNDKINVYIKDCSWFKLNGIRSKLASQLEKATYLNKYGQDEFVKKYPKNTNSKAIDTVLVDGVLKLCVNRAMYIKLLYDSMQCWEMLEGNGYKQFVCDRLDVKIAMTSELEDFYDTSTVEEKLDLWVGNKMFKNDQEVFMDFIKNGLFKGLNTRYGKAEINTINGYFSDNNHPYILDKKREKSRKSKNRDKWYWILSKKVYEVD